MTDSIRELLITTLSAQAYTALIALPGFGRVFALPVFSSVSRYIIERCVRWGVTETAVGLSILWIELDMSYEITSAEDARKKLKEMLENPAKYSQEEQRKIDAYFDETTIDLIQLAIKRLR